MELLQKNLICHNHLWFVSEEKYVAFITSVCKCSGFINSMSIKS